jgi:hypothetical protein
LRGNRWRGCPAAVCLGESFEIVLNLRIDETDVTPQIVEDGKSEDALVIGNWG